MSKRLAIFRQADLTRALRAARGAGLEVSGYEIDPITGKILITTRTSRDRASVEAGRDAEMSADPLYE
jgi:hypothetical protein